MTAHPYTLAELFDSPAELTPARALEVLKQPCHATTLLACARALQVPGTLVKRFRNGQELRAYRLPARWEHTRIRALPGDHFTG